MKTQQFISLKTLLSFSLVLVLLTSACAQSGKSSNRNRTEQYNIQVFSCKTGYGHSDSSFIR